MNLATSSSVSSDPMVSDLLKPHSGHLKGPCTASPMGVYIALPGDVALLALGVNVSHPPMDVGLLLDLDISLACVTVFICSVGTSLLDLARSGSRSSVRAGILESD